MPTDIVELCIAVCCVASLALVRSTVLAPRDGLGVATRAVATGMASTLILIIANPVACLLNPVLLSIIALPPSMATVTAPLVAMVVASLFAATLFAVTKKIHAPLHRLLASLAPAVVPATLLMSVVTAILAPSQNLFHAALSAVATGFGFTLLLRLGVAVAAIFDAGGAHTATTQPSAPQENTWRHALQGSTERISAAILLVASLMALLGTALYAVR